MLKIKNEIRFMPKYGVEIDFWNYHKYFHWFLFYFYWHHKSIWGIENDKDKHIQKAFRKLNT